MYRIDANLSVVIFLAFLMCSFTKLFAVNVESNYLTGKNLFFAKNDKASEAALSQVPTNAIDSAKAQYILGASLVRQGQLDKAMEIFSQIISTPIKTLDDRRVVDLAILAKARILYHQNKMRESVLAYQLLPADSDFKNVMRYEIAMVYIRYGDEYFDNPEYSSQLYQSAESYFTQLIAENKQMELDPRVQLALADLAMRKNNTAKALNIYQRLADSFIKIQSQLQHLSRHPLLLVDDLMSRRDFSEKINSSWLTSQIEIKPYLDQILMLQRTEEQVNFLEKEYRDVSLNKLDALNAATVLKQQNRLKKLKNRLSEVKQEVRRALFREIPTLVIKWNNEVKWLLIGAENGLMRGFLRDKFAKDKIIETIESVKTKELSKMNLDLGSLRGVEK